MGRKRRGILLLVAVIAGCQGDSTKIAAQNDPLLGARLGTPVAAARSVPPATQVAATPSATTPSAVPAAIPGAVPPLPSPTPPTNMAALATGSLPPADNNADLRIGNAGATLTASRGPVRVGAVTLNAPQDMSTPAGGQPPESPPARPSVAAMTSKPA